MQNQKGTVLLGALFHLSSLPSKSSCDVFPLHIRSAELT